MLEVRKELHKYLATDGMEEAKSTAKLLQGGSRPPGHGNDKDILDAILRGGALLTWYLFFFQHLRIILSKVIRNVYIEVYPSLGMLHESHEQSLPHAPPPLHWFELLYDCI